MVRRYYVYKSIWDASSDIAEELICVREPGNREDTHAVVILKEGITVGHTARTISSICSIFLRRGGTMNCLIAAGRRYSSDLPQGGLKIMCILTFEATDSKESIKTQRVLDNARFKMSLGSKQQDSDKSSDFCSAQTFSVIPMHPCSITTAKDMQVESFYRIEKFEVTEHITMGEKLNDKDIKHAQKILKARFPRLNGLKLTLYQVKPSEQAMDNWLLVIHCHERDHWILAATINCADDVVLIYNSVFLNVDEPTEKILYNVFPSSRRLKVSGKAQKQREGVTVVCLHWPLLPAWHLG